MKYILFSVLVACIFIGCQSDKTIQFYGIAADHQQGTEGLYNPGRGFRLETAIDVIEDKESPVKELINLSEVYKADNVSLVQSYIYLTNVVGQDLTEEHFDVMQTYFDKLQQLGMKSVLRFAYERDFNGRQATGPTLDQAVKQLEQLRPFLAKNKDLILVFQAGVIGAWGEWHSSVHGLENSMEAKRAILKKILDVVPSDIAVQVRVPEYKNILMDEPDLYKRLSFHDDMIIIKPHKWDGNMHEGTSFFDQIVKESPYLPMDGELPWGFWSINNDPDSPDPGWLIDGHEAARRFFLQHFTSLSVIHNYKEKRGREQGDNIKYSMQVWKETPLSLDFLIQNRMPVSANYFENKDGSTAQRNVFEYVKDHLGYRIELQQLRIPESIKKSTSNELNLDVINRGFSTVFNPSSVYFVLIDKDNNIYEFETNVQPVSWQPFHPEDTNCTPLIHTIKYKMDIPENIKAGTYKLGLWMPDKSERLKYNYLYDIRCANGNTDWFISPDRKYGINILTEVEIE